MNKDLSSFISEVDIRKNIGDTCEYEVSKMAMDIYKKHYQPFKNYKEPTPFEDSIESYFRLKTAGKDTKGNNPNYRGAYLLESNENEGALDVLTADLLTSIKEPINALVIHPYSKLKKGEEIKEDILNGDIKANLQDACLLPYLKAFAKVYYWCGNMMPMICNPKGKNDTWEKKMFHILYLKKIDEKYYKDFVEGQITGSRLSTNKLLPTWGAHFEREWFIKNNYLNDFFEKDTDDNWVIKSISPICNIIKMKEEGNKVTEFEKWFINNTKLIIQRSYRIKNGYTGDWDEESFEQVKGTIKEVLKDAGMSDSISESYSKSPY